MATPCHTIESVGKELETIIEKYNSLPTASSTGHAPIPFIKEGAKPRQSKPPPPPGILAGAKDWEMWLDLKVFEWCPIGGFRTLGLTQMVS